MQYVPRQGFDEHNVDRQLWRVPHLLATRRIQSTVAIPF